MVWLLGIPTDRKSFPQVAVNACSDRLLLYLPTFSKDNDAKKYQVELEARGICLYVFFVCLFVALCSTLFCFPSFLPSLFCLLTFSLFCRVELTLTHFFLARKKMDDNCGGGGGSGF